MRIAAILALAATSTGAAAPTSLPRGLCAIENAIYRLVDDDNGPSLRFIDDPKLARQSALSAVLRSAETKKIYRFTFAASNGYSTQYLVPATPGQPQDREGSDGLAFFMFDARLKPVELPNPGETAPDYLFVPDLGKTLWYGSMNDAKRELVETGMWRRSECGR